MRKMVIETPKGKATSPLKFGVSVGGNISSCKCKKQFGGIKS
jgi:hypothetical protein